MNYKLLSFIFLLNISKLSYNTDPVTWPEPIKELNQLLQLQPYNTQAITTWIQLNPNLLEFPMINEQTLLHQLLNHRDIYNFRLAMYQYYPYLRLHSKTSNRRKKTMMQQETILHALCRKGTDCAPDLPNLIAFALEINPNLATAVRGDDKNAVTIALNNPYINDETTLQILQILTTRNPAILIQTHQYLYSGQPYNQNKNRSLRFIFDPLIIQKLYQPQPSTYSVHHHANSATMNSISAATASTPSQQKQEISNDNSYVKSEQVQQHQLSATEQQRINRQNNIRKLFMPQSKKQKTVKDEGNEQPPLQLPAPSNQQPSTTSDDDSSKKLNDLAKEYQKRRYAEWQRDNQGAQQFLTWQQHHN